MKIQLTENQSAAVETDSRKVIVMAGPGSGKTRTVICRILDLIHNRMVDSRKILCITFTNAGAFELKKRLKEEGVDLIGYCGTIHSFMYSLIRANKELLGYSSQISLLPDTEIAPLLERIKTKLGINSFTNKELMKVKTRKWSKKAAESNKRAIIWNEYRRTLTRDCMIDFDMILERGQELLQNPVIQAEVSRRYSHLMVDEVQDSSVQDFEIYDDLCIENMFFVGDPDQCQPAGTMVRMKGGTDKPIEDIKKGDKVISYCRHSKSLVKAAEVSDVGTRHFRGHLYNVRCEGRSAKCTGNHKWLIRWKSGKERKQNSWCTYMMEKDGRFRIGKTVFFRKSGVAGENVIGLRFRMKQERADKAWVLGIHDNEKDAVVEEAIVSANFGLPQTCFTTSNKHVKFKQGAIDRIFDGIPDQLDKAASCLSFFGRDISYPLFDATFKRTRHTVQEIHACNLISGVMHVPIDEEITLPNSKRKSKWGLIEVSRDWYNGPVYSLDVEKHHKYVSNGIITCNSLFGFRGGDSQIMMDLSEGEYETITLETNFRSTNQICEMAQALISRNRNRFAKATVSANGDGPEVRLVRFMDKEKHEYKGIASEVVKKLSEGVSANEIAILCRYNRDVGNISETLREMGIPISKERKISEFYRGFDDAMMALSLIQNPENSLAAESVLAKKFGAERAAEARRIAASRKESITRSSSIIDFENGDYLAQALDFVKAPQKTKDFIISITEDCESISDALAKVRMMGDEKTTGKGGVTVTTIHGSKGKEWDCVFLISFEQETIPSNRANQDIESERQVAYVAITRARTHLTVSYSEQMDNPWGNSKWNKKRKLNPSSFLSEMRLV